ncbi:MAG: prephenate dehydratase domain-containing protein [Pyrinomonadaceae bacterium]
MTDYSRDFRRRVAFQGERGAFSEEAALKLLGPDVELVPTRTFQDLFAAISNGSADLVLAPVHNTIAGDVRETVDVLHAGFLIVLDEIAIRIKQHLIALRGIDFDAISTAQSHPVALAQCAEFFSQHPEIQLVKADDTAGSVAEIVKNNDRHRAAVAGRRAAEIYGGNILRENIQDRTDNYTRFVLLSRNH